MRSKREREREREREKEREREMEYAYLCLLGCSTAPELVNPGMGMARGTGDFASLESVSEVSWV